MTKPDSIAFRWRALIACILIIPAFAAAALSQPSVHEGSMADLVLDVLAWLFFLYGALLRFWSTLYIGGRKGHAVISDGPYSLCRHPLYVGTFLLAVSGVLFLDSPVMFAAVMLLGAFYVLFVIPVEEQYLCELLGDEYAAYRRRTPRLIPHLGHYHSPNRIEVNVAALWLEMRRAFLWLLLPAACEVLSTLRTSRWWSPPLHLP